MLWRLYWCDSCWWWWLFNTTSYSGHVVMVQWRLVEILKLNLDQYCWEFVIRPSRSTQSLGPLCLWQRIITNSTVLRCCNRYLQAINPTLLKKLKKKLCSANNSFADFPIILHNLMLLGIFGVLAAYFLVYLWLFPVVYFLAAPAAVLLIWEYLHKSN